MDYPKAFDVQLLPKFRSWACSLAPPARPLAYMANHLSTTNASIFLDIVVPQFLVRDDCVLVEFLTSDKSFVQWKELHNGDVSRIERSVNRLILWSWFDFDNEIEERAIESMAEKIAFSWRSCASAVFPDRNFEVSVANDYGPTVVLSSTP